MKKKIIQFCLCVLVLFLILLIIISKIFSENQNKSYKQNNTQKEELLFDQNQKTQQQQVNNNPKPKYKMIKNKTIDFFDPFGLKNLSCYSLIDLIVRQEVYLEGILQNSSSLKDNDEFFDVFLENLININSILASKIADKIYSKDEESGEYFKKIKAEDVELVLIDKQNGIYKFSKPKTSLFVYELCDEYSTYRYNEDYIKLKFSKYLSPSWKQYLYLSAKNKEPYSADGSYFNVSQ